ncbi:MAG TPA: hypothetical protein VM869_07285 [Enhygromyxa sp.]|nr:hypothetical protein [Enhygromyxa sp.]
MRDLTFSNPRSDELAPARALLTPTWVASLALLVANDHWLKGSGLLPGVVTGKLSDFAGMIVAPVLLAALLGVRSKRALALCHVAVALVFTGIQLSPAFADQWSALMGLVGYPWVITCDPTDLIALPFLLLSWAVLVPEMDASKPALVPMQRTAVGALSMFGLWSTVATSRGGVDLDDGWYVDVEGHIYVNNANDAAIALHIRPLRSDVALDCSEVARDPGRLLTQDAFGDAEHWELPGWTNVGIVLTGNGCGAAMIAGEGIPTTIVFVDELFAPQWFPGQTFEDESLGRDGMAVRFGDGGGEWVGGESIRFTPKTDAPELPDSCVAPAGELRLDWPTDVPSREVELLAIEAGVDGCFELSVQELGWSAGELVEIGAPYPFYLCAPAAAVPFAVGERLDLSQSFGNDGERELRVDLLEHDTLQLATDDSGAPIRRIRYLRGGNDPQFIGPAIQRDLVAIPNFECPWMIEEGCATVERPVVLAVDGDGVLDPGVPMMLESGAATLTAMVGYARERAIVDASCSDGALQLAYDIDFVVIEEPSL